VARKTLAELMSDAKANLKAANERLEKLEEEAAERYKRMAIKARLVELNIPEEVVLAEFHQIGAKFRAQPAVKAQAAPAEGSGAGTPSVAHE